MEVVWPWPVCWLVIYKYRNQKHIHAKNNTQIHKEVKTKDKLREKLAVRKMCQCFVLFIFLAFWTGCLVGGDPDLCLALPCLHCPLCTHTLNPQADAYTQLLHQEKGLPAAGLHRAWGSALVGSKCKRPNSISFAAQPLEGKQDMRPHHHHTTHATPPFPPPTRIHTDKETSSTQQRQEKLEAPAQQQQAHRQLGIIDLLPP